MPTVFHALKDLSAKPADTVLMHTVKPEARAREAAGRNECSGDSLCYCNKCIWKWNLGENELLLHLFQYIPVLLYNLLLANKQPCKHMHANNPPEVLSNKGIAIFLEMLLNCWYFEKNSQCQLSDALVVSHTVKIIIMCLKHWSMWDNSLKMIQTTANCNSCFVAIKYQQHGSTFAVSTYFYIFCVQGWRLGLYLASLSLFLSLSVSGLVFTLGMWGLSERGTSDVFLRLRLPQKDILPFSISSHPPSHLPPPTVPALSLSLSLPCCMCVCVRVLIQLPHAIMILP